MHYPSKRERDYLAAAETRIRIIAGAIVFAVVAVLLHSCPAQAQQPCIERHQFDTPGWYRCVAENERLRHSPRRYLQAEAERVDRQLQLDHMRRQMDYLQLQIDLQQLRCWGKC